MDKTALVEIDIRRSEKIVSSLENTGVRIAVAMWVHFPEYADWRFVLSSSSWDSMTLGDAYLKVNRALEEAGLTVWEIPPIFIMKTTDPFIRALRKVFRHAASVEGMRLGGQVWGDRFIDDAYAYKIA